MTKKITYNKNEACSIIHKPQIFFYNIESQFS